MKLVQMDQNTRTYLINTFGVNGKRSQQQPLKPAQPPNPFGAATSGNNIFGQPLAATNNPFGSPVAAINSTNPSGGNIFGAQQQQPQPVQQTNIFGGAMQTQNQLMQQPHQPGVASVGGGNIFGQPQSSQVAVNQGNIFGGQVQQQQQPVQQQPTNMFEQPVQQLPTNIFGQPVAPTSQSMFGQQQSTGNSMFGQPVVAAPPQIAQGQPPNPFGQQQQTQSPFGQPAAGANIFGAPAAAPTSNVFGGGAVSQQQHPANTETNYSKMEDLPPEQVQAFQAGAFELGNIPNIPPPRELCF